jgi:hypothetical protein
VREVAAPDVGRMGIEILSFTIKDVYDNVEYLESLGRAQTANVKRDADIGVAEANRDAGIREAECEKARMDSRYAADTKIADSKRMFEMQKANFDMEVNARVNIISGFILTPMIYLWSCRKLKLNWHTNCKEPKKSNASVQKKWRLMLWSVVSRLKLRRKRS